MQQSNRFWKHLPVIFIVLLPLGYLMMVWNNLPDKVPIHFNMEGEANGYSNPAGLLGLIIFMTVINVGVYLLMVNIHKIDPKRAKAGPSEVYTKIGAGVALFMSAVSILVLLMVTEPDNKFWQKALVPLLGLLFAFLGNVMYNIKPNYFAGIRVPWTLNDEDNWKKTHRVGGAIWFIGGIIITALGLVLPIIHANIMMQIVILIMVVIPIAYSYSLFKKSKSKQDRI